MLSILSSLSVLLEVSEDPPASSYALHQCGILQRTISWGVLLSCERAIRESRARYINDTEPIASLAHIVASLLTMFGGEWTHIVNGAVPVCYNSSIPAEKVVPRLREIAYQYIL